MTEMTDDYDQAESTVVATRSGRTPRDGGRPFSSNMLAPSSPVFTTGSPKFQTLGDISPLGFGAPRDEDCTIVGDQFAASKALFANCFGEDAPVSSQAPVVLAVETPPPGKATVRVKPPKSKVVAPEAKAPPINVQVQPMDISINGFSQQLFGSPPRPASVELLKRKLFVVNEFDEAKFHVTAEAVKVGHAMALLQRNTTIDQLMAAMNPDLHQTLAIMAHTLRLFGHAPESNPMLADMEQAKKRRKLEEDDRINRLVEARAAAAVEERLAAAVKARIAAFAASM